VFVWHRRLVRHSTVNNVSHAPSPVSPSFSAGRGCRKPSQDRFEDAFA
jgi:hypothetical protein